MFYVYILESKSDGKLCIGYTGDLRRRFAQHNAGNSKSTKSRSPFGLIYYEAYENKKDAQTKEKFLKTGWGRAYLKRNLKNYFQDKNLGG